ncbi:MAG: hypothetical protein A2144_08455 [Chloroflexi bacterium RBG_16_50_9]|nr:MAG: hypothetical protein A2144_08455 [Chloroflexi bacterium RBG_16_50_9]
MDLLHQHGVQFKTEVKLEEIRDRGIIIIDRQWHRYEIPADTVVLSLGVIPLSETVKSLEGLVVDTYIIGDCSSARNLMAAVHDAFNVAVEI